MGSAEFPLNKEFQFYQNNRERFLEEHEGKFLVIKDEKVIGVFDDRIKAIDETRKKFPIGTFLVQHVRKGKIYFHSRVQIVEEKK